MPENNWFTVFALSDLIENEPKEAIVNGIILAIVQIDDEIFALDGICAHQGGPLGKGSISGCILTCPWHGWQYDITDGKQILSEVIAQKTYRTRVVNDTIQVQITL